MSIMPPASRDLPPGRHEEIRAELMRTIEGEAGRPVRWRAPLAVATAAAAVLAVIVGVVTWHAGPSDDSPGVDTLSAADRDEIERGCAASARELAERMHPGLLVGDLKLVNVLEGETGTFALLLDEGPDVIIPCNIKAGPTYNAGYWRIGALNGPMRPEYTWAELSTDGEAVEVITYGRVNDAAVRVTYTADGRTWTASVDGNTFILNAMHDYQPGEERILRAYDADGNLLDSIDLGIDQYIDR